MFQPIHGDDAPLLETNGDHLIGRVLSRLWKKARAGLDHDQTQDLEEHPTPRFHLDLDVAHCYASAGESFVQNRRDECFDAMRVHLSQMMQMRLPECGQLVAHGRNIR